MLRAVAGRPQTVYVGLVRRTRSVGAYPTLTLSEAYRELKSRHLVMRRQMV
jgi:hypothetical protein